MIRWLMFIVPYLTVALALEMAVFPQMMALTSGGWQQIFDLRLLAMAGILVGLMAGEVPAMCVALVSALLFGFSQVPGTLGASIVSFSLAAWLAGWLVRRMRIQWAGMVWFWITLLLLGERMVWLLVRLVFFPNTPLLLTAGSLLGLLLTGAIGALIHRLFTPRLRRNRMFDED